LGDNDAIVRDAVRDAVRKSRQTGVRVKPHGIVNALASQGVKVTLTAVMQLRAEIERELGPMSPAERRRMFYKPRVQPPKRMAAHTTRQHPPVPVEAGDVEATPWPAPTITLTYDEYIDLCDHFRDDTDEDENTWIDLVYRLDDADPPFLGFQYGEDSDRRIDLGTFAIVLTAILAQRAENEGRTSAYDPDLPLNPLEIWFDIIGPAHSDPILKWYFWPTIGVDREVLAKQPDWYG
jgi:hypothetical protein